MGLWVGLWVTYGWTGPVAELVGGPVNQCTGGPGNWQFRSLEFDIISHFIRISTPPVILPSACFSLSE